MTIVPFATLLASNRLWATVESLIRSTGIKLMHPLLIRDWQTDDDVAAVTELLHAAYAELAESGLRFLASHQDDMVTRDRLESGWAFVGITGTELISTITLYGPNPTSPCEVYRRPGTFRLGQLAVRPDFQGRWIGLKMIAHAEARAREMGAIELALDTAEGAIRLRRWYERLGFRLVQLISWDVTNYRSVVMVKALA